MKRLNRVLGIGVAALGFVPNAGFADLWCDSVINDPSVSQTIVCEDFDRYCIDPPAYPQRCANNTTPNHQEPFLANWPEVADSGNPTKVRGDYKANGDPLYADSWPFSARYYSGANPDTGTYCLDTQHGRDLQPGIQAIDPGKQVPRAQPEVFRDP